MSAVYPNRKRRRRGPANPAQAGLAVDWSELVTLLKKMGMIDEGNAQTVRYVKEIARAQKRNHTKPLQLD